MYIIINVSMENKFVCRKYLLKKDQSRALNSSRQNLKWFGFSIWFLLPFVKLIFKKKLLLLLFSQLYEKTEINIYFLFFSILGGL